MTKIDDYISVGHILIYSNGLYNLLEIKMRKYFPKTLAAGNIIILFFLECIIIIITVIIIAVNLSKSPLGTNMRVVICIRLVLETALSL